MESKEYVRELIQRTFPNAGVQNVQKILPFTLREQVPNVGTDSKLNEILLEPSTGKQKYLFFGTILVSWSVNAGGLGDYCWVFAQRSDMINGVHKNVLGLTFDGSQKTLPLSCGENLLITKMYLVTNNSRRMVFNLNYVGYLIEIS